jgi:hypothetical protein
LEGLLSLKLKHNPIFQKHKVQIAEAIELSSASVRKNGQQLFEQMLLAAAEMDAALEPDFQGKPTPQIMSVKRDEFQKKCKDLGEWLNEHAPDLKLSWD